MLVTYFDLSFSTLEAGNRSVFSLCFLFRRGWQRHAGRCTVIVQKKRGSVGRGMEILFTGTLRLPVSPNFCRKGKIQPCSATSTHSIWIACIRSVRGDRYIYTCMQSSMFSHGKHSLLYDKMPVIAPHHLIRLNMNAYPGPSTECRGSRHH